MRLLTVGEVAKILGMSQERVYNLTRGKILPCVHVGRSLRWNEQEIHKWIENGGKAFPGGWKKEA